MPPLRLRDFTIFVNRGDYRTIWGLMSSWISKHANASVISLSRTIWMSFRVISKNFHCHSSMMTKKELQVEYYLRWNREMHRHIITHQPACCLLLFSRLCKINRLHLEIAFSASYRFVTFNIDSNRWHVPASSVLGQNERVHHVVRIKEMFLLRFNLDVIFYNAFHLLLKNCILIMFVLLNFQSW